VCCVRTTFVMGKECVLNLVSETGYSKVVMISVSTCRKCGDIDSNCASTASFSAFCNPLLISSVICPYVGVRVKLFWIAEIVNWKTFQWIHGFYKKYQQILFGFCEYNFIIQWPSTCFDNLCGHLQDGKCNSTHIFIIYRDHLKFRI
jgi:hypothetical protein